MPKLKKSLCQIKLRPEAFYAPAHQTVYNLVAELVDSNKPIDFITLKQALKERLPKPELQTVKTL
jgi:replicative DNA helicase